MFKRQKQKAEHISRLKEIIEMLEESKENKTIDGIRSELLYLNKEIESFAKYIVAISILLEKKLNVELVDDGKKVGFKKVK